MASSRNSVSPEPLLDAVAACLRRHLQPGQSIVVAFSGGRDSVALLDALQALRDELGFSLQAAHVNHGLSVHADAWQAFCIDHCAARGIPLSVHKVTVPRDAPEGLEAAARSMRYAILSQSEADWVACGHHRGDQAETLLFNLLRGAGVRGAAAMRETRPLSPTLQLMRPMLHVSRRVIEAYLAARKLDWVDDESNADTGFSRNFLRHEVMPLLLARFPRAEDQLAQAADHFDEARSLLDQLALLDLGSEPARFPLAMRCLDQLSDARARNVVYFVLAREGVRLPSRQRFVEAMRQFKSAAPDRHPAVVLGEHRLARRCGKLYLERLA